MGQSGCSRPFLVVVVCWSPRTGIPQGLTGTVIGTVRDEQGGVLAGARVTLSLPALVGDPIVLREGWPAALFYTRRLAKSSRVGLEGG